VRPAAPKEKNINSDYTRRKNGKINNVKPAYNGTARTDNFSVADRFFFIQVPDVLILDSVQFFLQRQIYVILRFRLRQVSL
jgi:hypothetical protein